MAVLSRVAWVAQQRVDLAHYLADESFAATDIRALVSIFTGVDKAYVFRGLEVVGQSGRTMTIRVRDCQIFNPKDGNGAFYIGLPNDQDIQLELVGGEPNIYVEAVFKTRTQSPVNTALWNPLPTNEQSDAGEQFSAAIDFQQVIYLEISANTVGFSDGAIPIAWAATDSSKISLMRDERVLFNRLGTPDNPLRKYEWSSAKSEPVVEGTGVADEPDSPWRKRDSSGALNDKAFTSLKDLLDAMMTRFSEITGSSIWYLSSTANSPVANLNLNNLFFDTVGHSIQPSLNSSFKWEDGKLVGEGTVAANGVTNQVHSGLVKWRSNYSQVQWELGGVFVNNTPGGVRNYIDGQVRFESPSPVSNGNVYLLLEREVQKGSGNLVRWKAQPESSINNLRSVVGEPGDFTGIAIGDYIRKESEGYSRYYKVVKMSADTTVYDPGVDANFDNMIADASIDALELDREVDAESTEALRYFRAKYSNNDLFADTISNYYGNLDMDFQWLGRRVDDLFILKDYGTMQEGEEVLTLDVTQAKGQRPEGSLSLRHAKEAQFSYNDYELREGSGNLVTIHKRKRDNTYSPTPDNSASIMIYTIEAPVGEITSGQSLWVRLSDSTGGALTNGPVTNSTDDLDNTDTNTNRWEVRDAEDSPLRTFDNRNVFLIATCRTVNGEDILEFCDGSILYRNGRYIDQNVEISGDLRVRGDLIVDGDRIIASVTEIQSDDKLVTLNVGGLIDTANGGGIELADDSKKAISVETYEGEAYIDLTFSADHDYVAPLKIGVRSKEGYAGISFGQITGDYNIVVSANAPGEAEVISSTVLRIYTQASAEESLVSTEDPPVTFESPWSIRLSDSSADYSGATSWAFRVKGVDTAPVMTPVQDYGTIATSHTLDMLTGRIPFAGNDSQGPLGASTTLNYSAKLVWEDDTLKVDGDLEVSGSIKYTNIKTITDDYTVLPEDHILLLDTSAASADITITLPDAATNLGMKLLIKDVGGTLSHFNKSANLAVTGGDKIYVDEDIPLPLSTDFMAFELVAVSDGWIIY